MISNISLHLETIVFRQHIKGSYFITLSGVRIGHVTLFIESDPMPRVVTYTRASGTASYVAESSWSNDAQRGGAEQVVS